LGLGPLAVLAAVSLFSAGLYEYAGPLPLDESWPTANRPSAYPAGYLLPADTDPEHLVSMLEDPLALAEFLGAHARYSRAAGILAFVTEYRMSADELYARGWEGDCNDLANAVAEMAFRRGYQVGLLSMWPSRWQDRLSVAWHQVAVVCVRRNQTYLIIDNGCALLWQGTLEEYADSKDRSIVPIGGLVAWRPVRPNPLARFFDHLRRSANLREESIPTLSRAAKPQML
jgi:hypothetical protein